MHLLKMKLVNNFRFNRNGGEKVMFEYYCGLQLFLNTFFGCRASIDLAKVFG